MSTRNCKALLVAAALPLSLLALAPSAEAGVVHGTALEGSPANRLGMFNDNVAAPIPAAADVVTYEADLTDVTDDAPVTGAPVVLQRKVGSGAWSNQGSVNTDGAGHAELTVDVGKSAKYRWAYAGDAGHDPATSNIMNLDAMRDFNADAANAPHNKALYFGDLNPGWGSRKVTLYKRVNNGSWNKVDTKETRKNGRWSFKVGYPHSVGPDWYWRVQIPGDDGFVKSLSTPLRTYTVPGRHGGNAARAIL